LRCRARQPPPQTGEVNRIRWQTDSIKTDTP
jgi:hypothetical protein